jgi:hypothetical protein
MPTPRLRRKAASRYLSENHGLPCAPSTLAKLAVIGGGPIFRRAGRIPLYETPDLDAYAASKLSGPLRSTSDARAKTLTQRAGDQGADRDQDADGDQGADRGQDADGDHGAGEIGGGHEQGR